MSKIDAETEPVVTKAKKDTKKTAAIAIPKLDIVTLKLKIVGDTELIVHQFSDKARLAIESKQQGKAVLGKTARVPEEEIESCFYKNDKGEYTFKSQAFKLAATECCTSLKKMLSKALVRQSHHVIGDMAVLHGAWHPRTDMARPQPNVCMPVYRPAFEVGWWCVLTVRLNRSALTIEQLIALYNQAGFSVGVGSWRPTRGGPFGLFHVEMYEEME